MKRIFLSRHAKTLQESKSGRDFDRELAPKSEKQIPSVVSQMKENGYSPSLWVCSTAVRAQQTAKGLAKGMKYDRDTIVDEPDVYGASALELVSIIQHYGKDHDSIMLTGHNPGMSDCATYLSDEVVRLSTGSIAVLEVEVDDWSHLGQGVATLKEVLVP